MEDITSPSSGHGEVEKILKPVSIGSDFEVLKPMELGLGQLVDKTIEIVLNGTHFNEVLSRPEFEDYFISLEVNLGLNSENLQPIKVEGTRNEIADMIKDQMNEIIENDELIGTQKLESLNVRYYYHPMAQIELDEDDRTDKRWHYRKLVSGHDFGPKSEG
jgi:hypothetical protein